MKLKLTCLALVLASSSVLAADPKPIAKVNGAPVSAAAAELMANEQIAQGAPNNEELRRAVKNDLIGRELLAQEAKKRGLDKKAEVQTRLEMARQGILVAVYVSEWEKANPITDEQIRADYDRRVAQMAGTEYKVRHVQTATEAEAQAVISKLQSGAKFADLAKDSQDVGSRESGGDIGWVSPNGVPKAFGEALVKLEIGKFTTVPVQTEYGFHVVMLEESRKAVPPPFEAKKNELRQLLAQQALNEHVNSLLKKAKVE